ncbi:MAG: roadblock/LC7 domain-containing protein [Candidatus Hodarchaeota archaeon]
MSDEMDKIRQILEQIGTSIPSIQYCLLMDRTGLLISSYGKYVFKEIDMDAVGALVGAVFQAGEEEGNAIEFKNLEIQINEYAEGFRFAVACEDVGVLSVISGKDVQIGLVRAAMKKYSPYLTKLMRKMFSTSGQEAMEDLKDLFSDFESFM